jgi:hypothetical protein
MHEVFLQRIGTHAVLRNDHNFRVFLEYGEEVSCIFNLMFYQCSRLD